MGWIHHNKSLICDRRAGRACGSGGRRSRMEAGRHHGHGRVVGMLVRVVANQIHGRVVVICGQASRAKRGRVVVVVVIVGVRIVQSAMTRGQVGRHLICHLVCHR